MPTVGVLIPTYNRAEYVNAAINSLLKGSHEDIKVLVYDDGSTDGTVIDQTDPRVVVYGETKNRGIPHARNTLLDKAKEHGLEVCVWQDSDDISHPKRIEKLLAFGGNHHLTYSWWKEFYTQGCVFPRFDIGTMGRPVFKVFGTTMFLRSKAPRFHPLANLCAEDTIWRKRFEREHGRGKYCPDVLYAIRRHPQQITTICKNLGVAGNKSYVGLGQYLDVKDDWNGYHSFELGGVPIQQNYKAVKSWETFLQSLDSPQIVEIGTAHGGFSALLAAYGQLLTIDIDNSCHPKARGAILSAGGMVITADSMSSLPLVQRSLIPDRPLVMICDGGNKPAEFNAYRGILRDGDYIAVHDYSETGEPVPCWHWVECSARQINLEGLKPVDGFENTAWGVWQKC